MSVTLPVMTKYTLLEIAILRIIELFLKIAFIGHSQGNGIAFVSLSEGMCPEIGEKLSCFVALAPAVFAGPLTHGFPFSILSRIGWGYWTVLFGTHVHIHITYVGLLLF